MIKKRVPGNLNATRKNKLVSRSSVADENSADSDNNDDEALQRIEAVRELNRLKRRCRGLPINADVFETYRDNRSDVKSDTKCPEDGTAVPSYRLLDKSFQVQQAARSDDVVDPHLEQFLQERLSSSNPSPSEPSVTATPESRKAEEELQKNLFELPDHLKVPDSAEREKDKMTWVMGLMEVPLPLDAKLKSIEEAEAAKRRELAMSREEQCSPLDILAHQTSVLGHRFRKPFPRKFV